VEITIEKMIYGGEGLGRLPPDESGRGKAVFVPFVLPDEKVSVELTEQRPGFARAKVLDVLTPSPTRTAPPCPYFGTCGGCHYQHTSYEQQLRFKAAILQETLQRTAKLTLSSPLQIHASEPWAYRNRTRMKVRTAPEFALGYYRVGSHDLLPVEQCPISSVLINRSIEVVWEVAASTNFPPTLREIQFFANHDDRQLLLELYIDRGADPARFKPLAEAIRAAMREVLGVVVFESVRGNDDESDRAPLTSSRSGPGTVFGAGSLTYKVAADEYRVSAGSFFQTNRFMAEELVRTALRDFKGTTALDLYAGTGLFTLPLARRFERVIAVEAAPYSFADLKHNAPRNSKVVQATTDQYLAEAGNKTRLDLVIVDPPRAGLSEKTARALGRLNVPRVTYVSCDPATLSRDLKVLTQSGFRVEEAHIVDLFPQTYHMESVLHLVR
jgi:23S rRNA (uracil1939-C5)-methyltransferase